MWKLSRCELHKRSVQTKIIAFPFLLPSLSLLLLPQLPLTSLLPLHMGCLFLVSHLSPNGHSQPPLQRECCSLFISLLLFLLNFSFLFFFFPLSYVPLFYNFKVFTYTRASTLYTSTSSILL